MNTGLFLSAELKNAGSMISQKKLENNTSLYFKSLVGCKKITKEFLNKKEYETKQIGIESFEDELFVKVKKNFLKWMGKQIPNYFQSYNEFARACDINTDSFGKFKKGKTSISLSKFNKMWGVLESKIKMPSNKAKAVDQISIKRGKIVKNPNQKINFNSVDGATVISSIYHDGSIYEDHRVVYTNNSTKMRKKVEKAYNVVFGKIKTNEYKKRVSFGKTVGEIINKCFSVRKYTELKNYLVPKMFKFGPKKLKVAWLKQAFDDEGTVGPRSIVLKLGRDTSYLTKSQRKAIYKSRKKHAPSLLKDEKEMLESLGVEVSGPYLVTNSTYIYKDKLGYLRITPTWVITITHKENLEKFEKIICFDIPYKKKKLKKILRNILQAHPKFNKGKEFYLNSIKKLVEKKIKITSLNVAKETNRSIITTRQWLKKLRKWGYLKVLTQLKFRKKGKFVVYGMVDK